MARARTNQNRRLPGHKPLVIPLVLRCACQTVSVVKAAHEHRPARPSRYRHLYSPPAQELVVKRVVKCPNVSFSADGAVP